MFLASLRRSFNNLNCCSLNPFKMYVLVKMCTNRTLSGYLGQYYGYWYLGCLRIKVTSNYELYRINGPLCYQRMVFNYCQHPSVAKLKKMQKYILWFQKNSAWHRVDFMCMISLQVVRLLKVSTILHIWALVLTLVVLSAHSLAMLNVSHAS